MAIRKTYNLPKKYVDFIIKTKEEDDTLLSETAALIKIIKGYMENEK